ncbi:MAG: NAD(P)/FAD-dependent oxidoreductase [Lachnospira sp.]|nr:NAD(P)/FAD-dependent oxidoreductase [Lachnospira sp.]
MMAAITAARNGRRVVLIEKNEKLGKKVFITGKGRCNFTNAGDSEDIFNSVVTNKKFLYSAFNSFSQYDCMGFFDELGLKFKIERGNRVFPESDHSSDVIAVLQKELKKLGVEIMYNTIVTEVLAKDDIFEGVCVKDTSVTGSGKTTNVQGMGDARKLAGDALIIATGGNSYQSTGSTGDGYKFAKSLGHTVTPILPALVPFVVAEEWERELQGLSLKNVSVKILDGDKVLYSDFGEMLFTHFGVSGPTVLSASSYAASVIKDKHLTLTIDYKPALTEEQLDERILRDFDEQKNKAFKNSLDKLLPKKLIPVVIDLSGIDGDKKVHEITKQERMSLVKLLKDFRLTLTGLRGFNEAIITQGGVNVKEINPSTMESKLVKGVFFAGEVIDVDAVTGGFNLQIAWSTGYVAGMHV